MAERICPQCGLETAALVCPQHQCPTITRGSGSLSQLQVGTVIDQRYRIEGQLGKGGFGAVFVASHVATKQQVVLKVLKPDLTEDPTQVQRFYNEARTSSLLSHPHTVRVHDFGQTDGGLLYIAMERLHGKELAQAMKESPGGRLPPARLLRIASAVCKSLSEAHHAGLVHRDLKPDNIFLCNVHGEEEFVKVIDFGIAKPVDAPVDGGLTRTGFTVGTPKYMSPEQVMQRQLDGRSDLYSLGIVMYQCLCGEVPFSGATPMETLMAHLQERAKPLAERVPGLPPAVIAVVDKAMAKKPEERWADADALRHALTSALAEVEGLPQPAGPSGQTGRNPAMPTGAAESAAVAATTASDARKASRRPQTQPRIPTANQEDPIPRPLAASLPDPSPLDADAPDATVFHAEVYSVHVDLQGSPASQAGSAHAALEPAETTATPAPTELAEPDATAESARALEPEITLYAQSPLPAKAFREADTEIYEHPTLREPYQPQTMNLPTAKLAESADPQAETLYHPAPSRPAAAPRSRMGIWIALAAATAVTLGGLGAWKIAAEPAAPSPGPTQPADPAQAQPTAAAPAKVPAIVAPAAASIQAPVPAPAPAAAPLPAPAAPPAAAVAAAPAPAPAPEAAPAAVQPTPTISKNAELPDGAAERPAARPGPAKAAKPATAKPRASHAGQGDKPM